MLNNQHIGANNGSPFNRHEMQQAYSQLALEQQPTTLLTLTVKEPTGKHGNWRIPVDTLISKGNLLLLWVNSELFGKKFKKNGFGLTGFGCIENQANHQPHLHLAITNPMPPNRLVKLKEAVFEKIQKFKLFDPRGVDVRPIGDSDEDFSAIGYYLAKEGQMVTLGADGVV